MERFKTIVGILLAVGIIFGTFVQFTSNTPFDFMWFINMLWFVIGFPVLFGLGWIILGVLVLGETEVKVATKKLKEEE